MPKTAQILNLIIKCLFDKKLIYKVKAVYSSHEPTLRYDQKHLKRSFPCKLNSTSVPSAMINSKLEYRNKFEKGIFTEWKKLMAHENKILMLIIPTISAEPCQFFVNKQAPKE